MNALFVANFGTGTGYAWSTIERVFRGVGEALTARGGRATVCYASLDAGPPAALEGSPVDVVEFDYGRVASAGGVRAFARLLREREVDLLYLTDRPTWSPAYPVFRLAGVRHIVVHDRTSGTRRHRSPWASAVKRLVHRVPGLSADRFVGVSRFIARRLREIGGTPAERTVCVYNGIDLEPYADLRPGALHAELGLAPDRPVVFFAGRIQPYKGVGVLVEAAEIVSERVPGVVFACCGDGSALDGFREDVARRGLDGFAFLGKRSDVPALLASATLAVVPSLWEEAFGLTVVEAMAAGVPVIASRVGGIPELVDDGATGLLVEPGDPSRLADAVVELVGDPDRRRSMGSRGREVARERFAIERTVAELVELVTSLDAPEGSGG